MATVDPALRERLLAQKKRMQGGGMLISNKGFTKMRLRVLPPREGELPGAEYISFYSKSLNKGTTSPASFGFNCPVSDALARINLDDDKGQKDYAKDFVRRSTEYWLPIIDRTDEGTPDNPRLRVLRAKKTVYQPIVDWMVEGGDDEKGDDVTHPKEGKDLVVRRTGSGLDTEWKVDKLDKAPISADKAMAKAWTELSQRFDVKSQFFPIDRAVLEDMYKGLTGESIPDSYEADLEQAIAGQAAVAVEHDDADESEETDVPAAAQDVEVEEGDLTGKTVTFDNDGTEMTGTVVEKDADEEGNWLVVEEGGDPNQPWSIPTDALTVVEAEADEEAEPEEAPEPPKPAKRTLPSKTTTPPKAAPKATAKPAPASMPRKPGASKAPAGKAASATIKDKMRKGVGKK